ncbi:LysR family transcriptional regulator [Halopseudomonas pertucinogena]|uniref:LysR family transcriptional regulator n=1 Tax=Halopseudomonas pertucinogena TaxID=86175 RepID=A0ABQ2CIH5_9GAMM|nr:LysR family transcriptional regulator [Halopseudomonas pertucinogena]GGI90602.1 LysR family transcriptional regulator [Halopseudomonas pertucinogena]
MDWDNLRFFLELSRAGRLTTAARRLGVDHTTVSRRVQALEKNLGVALFLRDTSGYTLTEAGRSLLPQVELMEGASVRIEQALPNPGDSLSGQVRIGATEGYGTMVAAQLGELSQRHPHLNLDLLALPRAVRLSRHEADIVITLERPERGPFIITKLSDYVLRLYAGRDYLEQHGPINSRADLEKHRFVSYVDDLVFSKDLLFLDEIAGSGAVGVRSTSVLAQQEAIAAGAGLGILPAFTADQDPRLQLIMPAQIRFIRTFWMLMPIELKDIARMRVTWDFLREQAERERGRLMGRETIVTEDNRT